METRYEKMRRDLISGGYYTEEEAAEIVRLEKQYDEECEEVAERLESEGYPAYGANYDLECQNIRIWYDEQIQMFG